LTAENRPSLLADIKSGFRIGRMPIVLLLATSFLWELVLLAAQGVPDVEASGIHGMRVPLFISLSFCSWLTWHLFYCWILTRWLTAEFGLARGSTPAALFRHVVAQQILACLTAGLTTIFLLAVFFWLSMPATFRLMGLLMSHINEIFVLLAIFAVFLVFWLMMGILIFATGTYMAVRFSCGLGIAAGSGFRMGLGKAFAFCAEAVPRGSAFRASLKYAAFICLASIGLAFLLVGGGAMIFPAYFDVNITPTTFSIQEAADPPDGPVLELIEASFFAIMSLVMAFGFCLTLIRLLRQIPTDIDPAT